MIIVCSSFLEEALKSSGVEKDIIYLPLALDFSDFQDFSPKTLKPSAHFTYGFVGSYEKRKNIELLASSFNQVFKGTETQLHIHISYNFCDDMSEFNFFINRLVSEQVKVTSGHLERKEYINLLKSIVIKLDDF